MWIICRGLELEDRCRDMEFSLYEIEGDAMVEEVENFKYLGRTTKLMMTGQW